jgi:hypothetical protein
MLTRLASAALALMVGCSLALADTRKATVEGAIVKVDTAARRGVSSKAIEDDRVAQGAPVSIVVSGKVLREVTLPYRNQIEK